MKELKEFRRISEGEQGAFNVAFKLIRDVCSERTGCYDCPFSKRNTARCVFRDNLPSDWEYPDKMPYYRKLRNPQIPKRRKDNENG